jgi:hypothetical protein
MNSKLDGLKGLVQDLCQLTKESEWVEFKHNNTDPKQQLQIQNEPTPFHLIEPPEEGWS